MRALLTVTHSDSVHEICTVECLHGSTEARAETTSGESRHAWIDGIGRRHESQCGCTCATEMDRIDAYPSIDSAVAQLTAMPDSAQTPRPEEPQEGLLPKIEMARCSACSVAIMLLTDGLRLVVVPLHDLRCANAMVERPE